MDPGEPLGEVEEALRGLRELPLPREIEVKAPEGYTWYGVHPEAWFEAARRATASSDDPVVVIGLRSIGTSLSAMAAAAFNPCRSYRVVVRPRGHPFDRRPRLEPELLELLRLHRDELFLIVDEGPGMSGSSLTGVAEAIASLDVPDSKIVLLPAWVPAAERLSSERARVSWDRWRKVVVSPDSLGLLDARRARGRRRSGVVRRSLARSAAPAGFVAPRPAAARAQEVADAETRDPVHRTGPAGPRDRRPHRPHARSRTWTWSGSCEAWLCHAGVRRGAALRAARRRVRLRAGPPPRMDPRRARGSIDRLRCAPRDDRREPSRSARLRIAREPGPPSPRGRRRSPRAHRRTAPTARVGENPRPLGQARRVRPPRGPLLSGRSGHRVGPGRHRGRALLPTAGTRCWDDSARHEGRKSGFGSTTWPTARSGSGTRSSPRR